MTDVKKQIKSDVGTQRGFSGVYHYSGKIFNPTERIFCNQREWAELAEQMYTYDSDIHTAWQALKNTLLSATFEWLPGPAAIGEDEELSDVAIELARSMNENMGLAGYSGTMDRSFENIMSQIVLYLPVGFRYFEVIWGLNKALDRFEIVNIKDRKPSAHDEWVTWPVDIEGNPLEGEYNTGKLTGVRQKPVSGDSVDEGVDPRPFIPAESLLLFVHDQEGDDYNGKGMLRPLEAPYNTKLKAELKKDAYLEYRPTVTVEIDDSEIAETSNCDMKILNEQSSAVIEAVKAFQEGRARYVPSYSRVKPNSDLIIDHSPRDSQFIIDAAKQDILSVFFVQFLRLGVTDTGSRSVGEVHSSFFRRTCINKLDYICSIFNGRWAPGKGLAGAYAYMNSEDPNLPTDALPVLVHKGLDEEVALAQWENLMAAYEKGVLTVTREDQQYFRTLLGAPQMEQEQNKDAISAADSAK